jgi:ribosomal protein S17
MNKGVQIILERIKSNPEEFMLNNSIHTETNKWADVIIGIRQRMTKMAGYPTTQNGLYSMEELSYLTDEEVIAMDIALKGVRRDDFTKRVMGKLLDDAEEGTIISSVTPKNIYASHEQVKAMRAYMKAEADKEQLKAHIEAHEIMLTQANLADALLADALHNVKMKTKDRYKV